MRALLIFLVCIASVGTAHGVGRVMLLVGMNQAYRWLEDSNATTVGFNSFSELPNGQQPTSVDFYGQYAQMAALADLSKAAGSPQASKMAYFNTALTTVNLAVNFPRDVGQWCHPAVDRDWWYIPENTNKIRRVNASTLALPALDTNGFPLTACSTNQMMPWTVITNRTHMFYTCGTFTQQVGNSANFLRGEVWMCANKDDLVGTPCQRLDLVAPDTITGLDLVGDNLYYVQAASRQIWKYSLATRTKTLFHTIQCSTCQITVNATYTSFDVPMRIRYMSDRLFYVNMFWHPTGYNPTKMGLIWRIDQAGQLQDIMMSSSTGIGVLDFIWMNVGDYYYSERQLSLFVDPPVAAPVESPIDAPANPPIAGALESPVAAPQASPASAPQQAPAESPASATQAPSENGVVAPIDVVAPFDNAPVDPPVQGPLYNGNGDANNNGSLSSNSMIPAIASAVAGAAFLIALIIVIVVVVRKRRFKRKGATSSTGPNEPPGEELSVTYGPMSPNDDADPERTRLRANTAQMRRWQTDKSELEFGEKIGSGNFGTVYEGLWRGAPVAIKQCKASLNTQDFKDETYLMAQLRPHKAVCQIYGVCDDESDMYLIMELVPGGNLLDLLRQKQVKPDEKIRIVQDLVSGMIHLHAEKILHRDLAARNVLMTSDGDAKLSDFGMSHAGEESFKAVSSTGPIRWMAPESLKSHVYSTKTDVYAFGILVWEIITDGQVPLANLTTSQVAIARRDRNETPIIPEGAPAALANICRKCWSLDPDERPTFKQIACELGKVRPTKSRMRYSVNMTTTINYSGIESNSNSSRPPSASPIDASLSTPKGESQPAAQQLQSADPDPDTPRKQKVQSSRKKSREESSDAAPDSARKRSTRSRSSTVGGGIPPESPKTKRKGKGEAPLAIPLSKLVLLRKEGGGSSTELDRPRTARARMSASSNKESPRSRKESGSSQQSKDSDRSARAKASLTSTAH